MISCLFCPVLGLFHFNIMSSRFIYIVANNRISFFLRLNSSIPLYVYITFCSFIHQWTFGLFPPFVSQCCYAYGCANSSLRLCFQYLWIYTHTHTPAPGVRCEIAGSYDGFVCFVKKS